MIGVAKKIAEEIASRGVIPFARFMELALYHPEEGYYEREAATVGRRGDYYTSVSVGSLFGELLASQFADWVAGESSTVRLVEAGAHRGELARDILAWMRQWRPEVFEQVEYWLVEPSSRRRAWQAETLSGLAEKTHWVDAVAHVAGGAFSGGVRGIIFSNELLDAFPVHRLAWDARLGRWFTLGVTCRDGRFEWLRMAEVESPAALAPPGEGLAPASGGAPSFASLVPQPPAELAAVLPDGFIYDWCPAATAWWREAATVLTSGRLLTFDYGLTVDELVAPERPNGTLRAYSGHQISGDLLANPGAQDLTAHVDFSALQAAGEAAGLETETFETQGRFLTRIAARVWQGGLPFEAWTPKHNRQFLTLTHPEHLGSRFRVLVQKTTPGARSSG